MKSCWAFPHWVKGQAPKLLIVIRLGYNLIKQNVINAGILNQFSTVQYFILVVIIVIVKFSAYRMRVRAHKDGLLGCSDSGSPADCPFQETFAGLPDLRLSLQLFSTPVCLTPLTSAEVPVHLSLHGISKHRRKIYRIIQKTNHLQI